MWKTGHGLDEYMAHLEALDGKEVHLNVHGRRPRPGSTSGPGPTVVAGPGRKEIEEIAAEVTQRILDYQSRRR